MICTTKAFEKHFVRLFRNESMQVSFSDLIQTEFLLRSLELTLRHVKNQLKNVADSVALMVFLLNV